YPWIWALPRTPQRAACSRAGNRKVLPEGALKPALLVRVSVLHQLDDGAVDLDERDPQEAASGAGRIERLDEHGVALERTGEIVDPVGDVRLDAQRTGDGRVRLEAE